MQSEVTWTSAAATTYYIYIFGFGSSTGTFELELDCPGPPTDVCNDAVEVFCGSTELGSNIGASSQATGFCGTSHAGTEPGVWYFMEGTGGEIVADVTGSGFDTCFKCSQKHADLFVLMVMMIPYSQSSVTFTSDCNETYYFYIFGFAGAEGAIT